MHRSLLTYYKLQRLIHLCSCLEFYVCGIEKTQESYGCPGRSDLGQEHTDSLLSFTLLVPISRTLQKELAYLPTGTLLHTHAYRNAAESTEHPQSPAEYIEQTQNHTYTHTKQKQKQPY